MQLLIHLPRRGSSLLALTLALLFCGIALLSTASVASAETLPKTVVLGFDGADGDLTKQWMDEGKLPNLARLRDEGTFAPLRPTIPSQTPVSWSTFATGLDPGRHTITDFLKRDPANYRPQLALVDEGERELLWGANNSIVLGVGTGLGLLLLLWLVSRLVVRNSGPRRLALVLVVLMAAGAGVAVARVVSLWVPEKLPTVENPQQGDTMWELLGAAGHRVRVLRMPQTFPPKPFHHGNLLTGLGTPDLSLRVGKPFYFTSELFFEAEDGGFSLEVVELIDNRGSIPTQIKGPPDRLFSEPGRLNYIEIPMQLEVSEARDRLSIDVSGQQLELAPGQWSEWVNFEFPFNPLISMYGIGRFHLLSLEPEVKLYLSPIQFDPAKLPPSFELSTPPSFAKDLMAEDGYYKTIGWAIDTWSMNEGTIPEALFLEDVEMTVSRYEQMLEGELAAMDDWDVLIHYFEFTDKVQHVMFRLFDEEHPVYDPVLAAEYGGAILDSYRRMDSIVGRVMDALPEDGQLYVVSDHGFSSWRWSMNYNTWLAKNGYMVLKGEAPDRLNLQDLFDQGDFFVNVDWSQTRAYALGFGNIFLNLEGREAEGIVKREDYDELIEEIRGGLLNFVHEETGLNPVAHIFRRDEAYDSFDPQLIPDMIATNTDYYRAGWQDTLGGIASAVVEPNTKRWSGDHCSLYPPLVEGILFSNQRLRPDRDPYMADIMPTLLELYGVDATTELDGVSLLRR
ncbi:MAG: alkaline phosphatase family protein [Acidobacteriota bacterium]